MVISNKCFLDWDNNLKNQILPVRGLSSIEVYG